MNRVPCVENYKKSDKSLHLLRTLLLVIAWILALSFIALGIYYWSTAQVTVSTSRYSSHQEIDGWRVAWGFIYAIGGPLISALLYNIFMPVVWLMYDLKVIRTYVSGSEMTTELKDFVGAAPADQEPSIKKPADQEPSIKKPADQGSSNQKITDFRFK